MAKTQFEYNESEHEKVLSSNCTMYKNGVLLQIGDIADIGDELKLVCNTGYEFSGYVRLFAQEQNWGYWSYLDFVIDESNKIGILTLENISDGDYITSIDEIITTQVDNVTGSNSVFKISDQDLKQINIDRFVTDGGNPPSVIDYGVNILGVINLPFEIDSSYIQESETIKLGTHETTVTAPKISVDKLFYNLGDIVVNDAVDSIDYTNVKALLHLPYAPSLNLELDYTIGYTINVEYVIDLYSGDAVINVKSSKNGDVVLTSNVNLGVNIPYMFNETMPSVNNVNVILGGDNHIRSPYIELVQNTPILADGFFTIPIVDENLLNTCEGFVRVEEIELNSNALSYEKSLILNALKSGVIIK